MISFAQGILFGDQAGPENLGEGLFHGTHSLAGTGLDRGVDLMGLAFADDGGDRRSDDEHFARRNPSVAISARQQNLRDDPFETGSEHHPDLFLLIRWKNIDDPVDRLSGILSMKSGEHQVS